MSHDDSLYPIALLVEEMKSEDTEVRINAMRQLRKIAAALGADRTRKELIPFLNEQVEDDDEVLLVMAEELGGFIDLVGGPAQAVILMGPLGALATVEETVVREKAVESANLVIQGLDNAAVVEHVLPVIQKLTLGDWFTARVSACGLFAATYARLTDAASKATLRAYFQQLCQDETPMVKRAASKAIGSFARAAAGERDVVLTELLPLFNALAGDDQDSVRLLAIENCTAFASVLSEAENNKHILPLVKACALDKSWRVRNNVAREFAPLSRSVGRETTRAELLPLFTKLLSDPEAEVRASASRNMAAFVELVGPERFLSDIQPLLRELVADPAQNVRTAVAESLMDTATKLPHDVASAYVVPFIMSCLRDEAPEVRLKVLESLSKIVDAVGSGFLESTILPALITLGNDALWRVREKVIDQMPLLAAHLGPAVFEEKVLPLYLNTYQDQVNAVRMAATKNLKPLAMRLGAAWARSRLVPKLRELYSVRDASYLQRITVLYGIKDLAVSPDTRDAANDVLDLLVAGLRDSVPNVRFIAAQIVREALEAKVYDATRVAGEIRPALVDMQRDADQDVRHFATEALARC